MFYLKERGEWGDVEEGKGEGRDGGEGSGRVEVEGR